MATGNAIVDAGKLHSSMNSTSDHVLMIFPKIGSYFCCQGFKLLSLNPFVNNAIQLFSVQKQKILFEVSHLWHTILQLDTSKDTAGFLLTNQLVCIFFPTQANRKL